MLCLLGFRAQKPLQGEEKIMFWLKKCGLVYIATLLQIF